MLGGDKLMENVEGVFKDVSEESNIYGVIGFGFGVTVGDTNGDGWEDIFVSNDFFEGTICILIIRWNFYRRSNQSNEVYKWRVYGC